MLAIFCFRMERSLALKHARKFGQVRTKTYSMQMSNDCIIVENMSRPTTLCALSSSIHSGFINVRIVL
jgi:hypothetical protein